MSNSVFAQRAASTRAVALVGEQAKGPQRVPKSRAQKSAMMAARTRDTGGISAQGATQAAISADKASINAQGSANQAVNAAYQAQEVKSAVAVATAQPFVAIRQSLQATGETSSDRGYQ